ncbi:MAG: 50S ribosomal protein L32e [Desulfurococcales archaeon]|nr:50S ribosomal protein L32e [Desulfurococcales archaeon]
MSEEGGPKDLREALEARRRVIEKLRELRRLQKKLAGRKKGKPEFLRYLSWKFWKFERREYWRKPKGIDNKMRLQLKGYPPIVKSGYGSDSSMRGLHPSGLKPVVISSPRELEGLDPEKHIIYIASTVSVKKAMELRRLAEARGFRVAN